MLRLEKLLHLLPERDRTKFLEQVLKGADHVLDAETQTTLEQFFALDCNVSETAKKLYVHRNTLLYRLDKFKNETGLDVRTFSDAVLVRIALLLYKVTKRK
jgi:DNA-binding PucR family transcriptional regulator